LSIPFIDSQSTSSETSDISDYIETLSLSSHSSSENSSYKCVRYFFGIEFTLNEVIIDRFWVLTGWVLSIQHLRYCGLDRGRSTKRLIEFCCSIVPTVIRYLLNVTLLFGCLQISNTVESASEKRVGPKKIYPINRKILITDLKEE